MQELGGGVIESLQFVFAFAVWRIMKVCQCS